ncbi:MAG: nickel pincer cofactor biosynthesis protein LarC [Clostridiales bacterium]|nr:nickel pincer cofactor biosynthesis protein LarC [Clostridiales bacterium]
MNRILYLEGSSGISGDMTVSALLDLGVSKKKIEEELQKLPLDGYRLVVGKTNKNGIEACAFYVELDEKSPQPLRDYRQIRELLAVSHLEEAVKTLAIHIFTVLAKAEAKVHGTTVEQVHFHEVGAVDSIVDIVAAAIGFVELGINQVAVGTLTEGTGTTWCQHGRIPVPVPATAELIREYGLSVKLTETPGEMITPTGAAIAAAVRNCEVPAQFTVEKIGIGSGEKDFPHANILRAMILRTEEKHQVTILETNVDDCTGEQLGYLQEILLERGALDAIYRPILMKKSRPAYQLQVICRPEQREELEEIIFRETTTIGIRSYQAERTVLERRSETVETPHGKVRVKVCKFKEEAYYYPEYEDVKKFCRTSGLPFREAYQQIQKIAEDKEV